MFEARSHDDLEGTSIPFLEFISPSLVTLKEDVKRLPNITRAEFYI
jgi:hypothetical protein